MANKAQASQAKTYYDFVAAFDAGVNMGIEPLLLPKNQLAESHNVSVRGAYVTHRPPHLLKDFIWPDIPTQTAFEQGLFQGGGYYRPDFGTAQLIVSISGHIYSLTETAGKFVVADISIFGDLNDAGQHQVWMWQPEKWLIISDGTGALPIFYDGTICRRSYGPSVVLGTVTAASVAAPPAIGATVDVTLLANYTGPFNVPVIFHNSFYQPTQSLPGGYNAVLTNLNDTPTNVVPSGTDIIVQPGNLATITGFVQPLQKGAHTLGSNYKWFFEANTSVANYGGISPVRINGVLWTGFNPTPGASSIFVTVNDYNDSIPGPTVNVGDSIQNPADGPNVIIGTTQANYTVPAVNGTVNVILDVQYTGSANQLVWVDGKQYFINQIVAPPASTTLTLLNLTDTSPANYVFNLDILSVPEIPAARMGAYGMGRTAFSHVNGISFDYGDIVGGAAGTSAYNFRDSVLKMTESTFQSGGGSFNLPGSGDIITAMIFGANLDVSLGQGPLQVGTANSIFTCQVGFDRTTWASTTNPILTEALIGNGPQGQWSTTLVNSDIFFRSTEGAASEVMARRDFFSWGNVPISQEMKPVYDADDQTLLQYGSKIDFDNRSVETVNPVISSQGVYHDKLVSMSFDTISNLRTKLPPVYEGTWEGLNILQTIVGNINGSKRCFAFVANTTTNKIELYELLRQSTAIINDNGTDRITWQFDTPILFNKDIKGLNELVKLDDGEIYTKDIQGTVDVEVQYRPDFNPAWTSWHKWTMDSSTWKPRIGLGEPDSKPCEVGGERQMKVGYFFQLRVIITGHIKFMGLRAVTSAVGETEFAKPICTT